MVWLLPLLFLFLFFLHCCFHFCRLDIEGPGVYWSSDQAANANFFHDMAAKAKDMGNALNYHLSHYHLRHHNRHYHRYRVIDHRASQ